MGQNIYSGTIAPKGYELLSNLTGVTFEEGATYQIQLLNPAYLREGTVGRGFLVNTERPFTFIADANLFIAVPPQPFGKVALNISLEKQAQQPTPTDKAIVDLAGIDELYRDSSYKLYKDVSLETPLNATLNGISIQAMANPSNTITVGSVEYVKLTASTQDVINTDNKGLVVNPDNMLCELVDGVPETTNIIMIDTTN